MADTQKLAAALMSTAPIGEFPPDQENQFQTFMGMDPSVRRWRNDYTARYGEQPDTNNPDFDYRRAFLAGNKPMPYSDGSLHWDSRGKAPNHPTAWMQTFFDQNNGADPVAQSQAGFTPPQSKMVNDQLSADLLTQLLHRLK